LTRMKYSLITGAEVASSFTILPRCTLVHILEQSRSNAVVNQSRAVCALVHRFKCRESFRRDGEESFCRREILNGLGEVRAVNVGDEPTRHGALAVMLQRFVGHDRPKVGAAATNIDVANRSAGVGLSRRRCAPARKSPPSYRARREPGAGPVS